MYHKENLPKIKLVRPRMEDEEEMELEEQYQNEEDIFQITNAFTFLTNQFQIENTVIF